MGLGGHLLWSSVIRTLHQKSRRPVTVSYLPLLSDIVARRLHDGGRSLDTDEIFRNNPRIAFPPAMPKSRRQQQLDRVFLGVLHHSRLRRPYERIVFRAAHRNAPGFHVHVDMELHSYAKKVTRRRMEWREGGHIIDILAGDFGVSAVDHRCELYFTSDEMAASMEDRRRLGLDGEYVVVEPNSREGWFGDLRTWPFERWQALADALQAELRCRLVQIGEAASRPLDGVLNLSGLLPFRRSALLMKQARLFVGQEGGLNHVANAVDVPSVMIWGGLTLPEFAAYKEFHTVVCTYVECAPCGLRGDCPFGKKCLTSIAPGDVLSAVRTALDDRGTHSGRFR